MIVKFKKVSFGKTPLFMCFFFMLFLTQTPLGTSNYSLLNNMYVCIDVAVLVLLILQNRYPKKSELYTFSLFLIPYLCLLVLSCFEAPLRGGIALKSSIKENFVIILVLTGMLLYLYFRERLLDYIFYACICNYTIYFLLFLLIYGWTGLLHFVELSEGPGKILEVHEVTYIIAILVIYYLMHNQNHKNTKKIILGAVFIFFGFKRILLAGLLLALLVYLILVRHPNRKKTLFFCFMLFCMCAVWLAFVTSPYYETTAKALGVNLMSRTFSKDGLYGRLNGYYTMSPLYIGYGVGFVHRKMINYAQYHEYAGTTGFHNDILKYYIDIGFIPWVLFFGNMTIGIGERIRRRISINSANRYLLLLAVTLVCWTTDNLSTYPNYLVVSNLIYVSVIMEGFREPMEVRKGLRGN